MGKQTSVVEINGNRYDAATGQIISAIRSVKTQVIDGFVKSPAAASTTLKKIPKIPAQISQSRPSHSAKPPARNLHARTAKGETLMRGALKKPTGHFSARLRKPAAQASPERQLRAKQIEKHSQINRFGIPRAPRRDASRPVVHGEVIPKRQPAPAASVAAPLPSMVTSVSHQKLERLLDEALTRADSHKQALKYQAARHFWQRPRLGRRTKMLVVAGLAAVGVVGTLAVAWQKIPQVSVKVASFRAHISASTPGYIPAGYSVAGPAKAINRAVSIQYKAAGDSSKAYTVKEQSSSQDSSSLIADNTTPDQPVQTAQANGVPIVIVPNKAMCVSNGIQTTVVDHASLAPDELLNIAKSVCG